MHTLCRALQVSRSAYYIWRNSAFRADKGEQQEEAVVVELFKEHRRRYGVRRLVAELRAQGVAIGSYKVRAVLQKHGLKAIQPFRR